MHSCQPSLVLLISCKKCYVSTQWEAAETRLRRPRKTPEIWRESSNNNNNNNNNNDNDLIMIMTMIIIIIIYKLQKICHILDTKNWSKPSHSFTLVNFLLMFDLHCWFARDVTAAMLVVKNKSLSLLWELNSIFM